MRPTPTLKGKSAKRFYEKINQGEISTKQKKFLDECLQLLDEHTSKEEMGDRMKPEPLRGKIKSDTYRGDYLNADVPYFRMFKSATEGLIQYHEDYIEDLVKYMCKVDDTQDNQYVIDFYLSAIIREYIALMHVENWYEDVINAT